MKIYLLSLLLFNTAIANELHMSGAEALRQGFRPVKTARKVMTTEPAEHSLPWPVKFIDQRHTIGNSMPEYQNYGTEAYYHEGADLRVSMEREVTAPVDGFLQGDFYTYVTDQNTGEDKKYTKPMSEGGDDLYFEITIKTADDFQFELHHINSAKLPKNIVNLISRGGGAVHQGGVIGSASLWPMTRNGERYDHIHYNLLSPAGVYMNPEYYSQVLVDNSAPVIRNIFAIYKDHKVEVLNQKLSGVPSEIIVSAYDMKGENVYQLPPSFSEIVSVSGQKTTWDFTKFFTNSTGTFPDIREVYARNLKLSDGRSFTTKGDYSNTVFLMRLKVPPTATGPLTLTLKDSAMNQTQVQLEIQ